jgi:hypothetical protein
MMQTTDAMLNNDPMLSKVTRPAASNTGRNRANVRRTLDSAMLKK